MASPASTFLQKIQSHSPSTTHLLGFLILFFVSASILLILTGITLIASVFGFIFFMPLIIVSSPVWFPICALLFLAAAGFLSACGFGVAVVAGSTWMYRYFRGMHPPGSDRVDSARSRIYDTASHVKDYAIEYGGYLQSKVKDAAPGA
ncbi:phosphoribosylaminoimidazole carboxylase [Hibiscus syriacus]|uniref:Phosphoribosylaminoimidazole carboxylase n=1 Tax=Hibiscus syriacus TaxID=106335 RepID=A0A6A3C868_HIBSY|nr:oleosin-like [Hibiscus syriacus]KAE8724986.1 phosphoribosylaminoimidazole carboxylase [Hibiscus syriacus]